MGRAAGRPTWPGPASSTQWNPGVVSDVPVARTLEPQAAAMALYIGVELALPLLTRAR